MANKSMGLTPQTDDFDFEPPEVNLDTRDERKTARITKTKQWKQAVEYIEDRQGLYRQYLPGVNPAIHGTEADWRVADCIVKELEAFKNVIEGIASGVSR